VGGASRGPQNRPFTDSQILNTSDEEDDEISSTSDRDLPVSLEKERR
jgi:hypothetical protein